MQQRYVYIPEKPIGSTLLEKHPPKTARNMAIWPFDSFSTAFTGNLKYLVLSYSECTGSLVIRTAIHNSKHIFFPTVNPAVSEDRSTDRSRGRPLHAHACAPPYRNLLICSLCWKGVRVRPTQQQVLSPEDLRVSPSRNLDWPEAGTAALLASQRT